MDRRNSISQASIDEINAQYGKLPPQAIDVEEVVLGALMLEQDAIIANPVKVEWFYKEVHQKIVYAILELNNKHKPIDIIQVTQFLKDHGQLEEIGGAVYISQLTRNVASAAHIEFHIRIIYQKFLQREIIRITSEAQNKAFDETIDVDDLIDYLQSQLLSLSNIEQSTIKKIQEGVDEVIKQVHANRESKGVIGIPTGFSLLDKHTGGWQGGDLVVLAGENSQGKTSLALDFVNAAGSAEIPCAIYSMEMNLRQLSARFLSKQSGVSSKRILFNKLYDDELTQLTSGVAVMSGMPIYVDEKSINTSPSICASIRMLVLRYGIKMVVIDYLQMIKLPNKSNRNDSAIIGEICTELKTLAKELNITIFLLSQLRREGSNPMPTVERLRGSGEIEERADIIILIYRPEYYNKPMMPEPYQNLDSEGLAFIKVGKGRNIGVGGFLLQFKKETTTFSNFDNREYPSLGSPF